MSAAGRGRKKRVQDLVWFETEAKWRRRRQKTAEICGKRLGNQFDGNSDFVGLALPNFDASMRGMKGFPNQVADLAKLATGMRCISDLLIAGENPRDDGVLGIALVYAGVAGTGHKPLPPKEYIQEQLRKNRSDQSFRTTARGLRELYDLMGLIDRDDDEIRLTDLGERAVLFSGTAMDSAQIEFWRLVVRNIEHYGGEQQSSHPYQVLLRLIAQRPGITRAKCALALEARGDSSEELERIVALSDLDENQILRTIRVSENNWNNAKKILPKFAEQLGDVIKVGGSFYLADAPGSGEPQEVVPGAEPRVVRAPRSSRRVSAETIGKAGTGDAGDEVEISPTLNAEARAHGIKVRRDRLRRHNLIVQALAQRLVGGPQIYEDPFDLLAIYPEIGILIEVKTLDGTVADERERVKNALSQLLYYEAFLASPMAGEQAIVKIACFESEITAEHRQFLNHLGIGVMWQTPEGFHPDKLARASIWNRIE